MPQKNKCFCRHLSRCRSGIAMILDRRVLLSITCVWLVPFVVDAQESNFGVKVKCFLHEGTIVCPGCNTRAGLLCPKMTNKDRCNIQPELEYTKKETPFTHVYEEGAAKPTPDTVIKDFSFKNTTHESFPTFPSISEQEIEYWAKKARENPQFRLFLYRILFSRTHLAPRWKRDTLQAVQDDDTCKWNGDCPCPLICCSAGDGCPKKCMKGIKLPPPFG